MGLFSSIAGAVAGPLIGGLMGGSGSGSGSTTQTMAPWGPAQPHLQNVLKDAGSAYKDGQFGMSPLTYEAIQQTLAGIGGMSPSLYGSASGQYLDPAKNPGFQVAMDRARQPVDSYMAKAGRYGSGAHAGQIAESFANVAADQYNKERLLQLQTVPTLMGLSDQFLGLNREVDSNKYNELAKYFGFAQPAGGLGGTQTNPYYSNRAAGALGGAMMGAQMSPWIQKTFGGLFDGGSSLGAGISPTGSDTGYGTPF